MPTCETKTIEKLSFNLEIKSIHEDDEENFQFVGHASTFDNVDLGDDIVERGAFVDSLRKRTPKLVWQHDTRMPLGIFTEIFEDEVGLFVKAKMPWGS